MDFNKLKIKCECGGSMQNITTTWKGIGVRGWKCRKCGEEVLNPADSQRALEIDRARKRNELTVKIRRVGKSNVVTVPQALMETEKLRSGQKVEWGVEKGRLVLTP